jgi:hypothetical protein
MTNFLTFFGAILGSGAIAAIVGFALNARKDQAQFMRGKAEELYIAADQFHKMVSGHYLRAYSLIKEEISWDDFNDLTIKNAKTEDAEASRRVNMLFDIYFPNLVPSFKRYLERRDKLAEILSMHKRMYKNGQNGRGLLRRFDEAMQALISEAHALKEAVVSEARHRANIDQVWFWKRLSRRVD